MIWEKHLFHAKTLFCLTFPLPALPWNEAGTATVSTRCFPRHKNPQPCTLSELPAWARNCCPESASPPKQGADEEPPQLHLTASSSTSHPAPFPTQGGCGAAVPAALPVRLGAVGAELLGQLPVAIGEGGHQVGAVLHLDLVGTGADGHTPRVGGHALPGHRGPLQEVVADHVAGFLHLDGDLLGLGLLLQGQARQPHGWGRGTVTRLREDCVVGWHPLELGLGGCTYEEQRLSAPILAQGKAQERAARRAPGHMARRAQLLAILSRCVRVQGSS